MHAENAWDRFAMSGWNINFARCAHTLCYVLAIFCIIKAIWFYIFHGHILIIEFLSFLEFQTLKALKNSLWLFQDNRQPPSWISWVLHGCDLYIHWIWVVKILPYSKSPRNLFCLIVGTLPKKGPFASGLIGVVTDREENNNGRHEVQNHPNNSRYPKIRQEYEHRPPFPH